MTLRPHKRWTLNLVSLENIESIFAFKTFESLIGNFEREL